MVLHIVEQPQEAMVDVVVVELEIQLNLVVQEVKDLMVVLVAAAAAALVVVVWVQQVIM